MTRLDGTRLSWALAAVALLVGVVVIAPPAPVPASAQAAPARPSTPVLLAEARDRGEIDPGTADLYLARILAGGGTSGDVPGRFQSETPWDGTLSQP